VLTTRGSDFDTTLGVFTGSAVNALTSIVQNDDEAALFGIYTSRVSFQAVAGTTYRLQVDGYHGAVGNIALGLTENVPPPAPANDSFDSRIVLAGANVSTTGANNSATLQSGEPRIAGISGGHSVWWSWTAPASGQVTISTAGSDFDTLLGVYTGTALSSLQTITSNDDQNYFAGILTSRVSFQATAGVTYQIAVDGYHGAAGNIALSLSQAASAATATSTGRSGITAFTPAAVDLAIAELLYGQAFMPSSRSARTP
jgi:hypothetical protein